MKSITHEAFLEKLEQMVEEQLKEVISVFQNLPEDRLLQPAADGGWSIAECFAHLNSYADFYLPRVGKAIEKAPSWSESPLFKHGLLGQYFITMMDPDRSKKKFNAMKKHSPMDVDGPYRVVSTFIQHLENIFRLLLASKQKNLNKTSIATSISPLIKINAGDALLFVLTHNRRHLAQARRNLNCV
jgi:uncharacterized damage-inducible protein DinB